MQAPLSLSLSLLISRFLHPPFSLSSNLPVTYMHRAHTVYVIYSTVYDAAADPR